MHRAAALVLACLVTGMATPRTAVAQGSGGFDFVDTTDFPTVRLVISPPAGTSVADLVVRQDGVRVDAGIFPLVTDPVEMVLLLDVSGSMAGAPLEAAKAAALEFAGTLPPGSDISVLAFGDSVSLVSGSGDSRVDLETAITSLTAGGETALYDAVVAAAGAIAATPRSRQFVVALTDGGDTASAATLALATAALAAQPVGFFAISLAGSEPDPAALDALAGAAGGRVVAADDASALSAIYSEIADELVSQYAVVFEAVSGGPSRVDVALSGGALRFTGDLTLPVIATGTGAAPVTLPPQAPVRVSPPRQVASPDPSWLEEPWTLDAGAVLVAITLAAAGALLIAPGSRLPRLPRLPGAGSGGSRLGLIGRGAGRLVGLRRARGIDAALDAAGMPLSAGEFLGLVALVTVGGLGVGVLTGSLPLALTLVFAALALPRLVLAAAADRRRAAFADQLEGTLQLVAGSLRAGYGLAQAFSTVAQEAPRPTSDEFGRVVVETRVGRDQTAALRAVATRMRNQDFAWVTDAIDIQREVGGNLAEVLDAVAATIRDRNQIRRQVRALSAEGRISAVVLVSLPIAAATLISLVNPGYLEPLLDSTGGKVAITVGVVLMVIGIVWIRRIVKVIF